MSMKSAFTGPNKPIKNLGAWRPIEDLPKDKTYVSMTFKGGKVDATTRKRALMRSFKTRVESKYTAGGARRNLKPVTLAKVSALTPTAFIAFANHRLSVVSPAKGRSAELADGFFVRFD